MQATPLGAALAAFQKGDLLQAEALVRSFLAHQPWDVEGVQLLASLAVVREHSATAVALIGELLQKRGASLSGVSDALKARVHQTLGRALLAEGHGEAARGAFLVSARFLPEESATHAGLGETLLALGRPEEALPPLKQAVRLAPRQPALWNILAQAHTALGQMQQAEEAFRQCVTLDPEDGLVRANWGAALFTCRRLEDAAAQLIQALALGAGTPETLTNLALVRLGQGHVAEACAVFEEAQAKAPQDERIRLNHSTALYEAGDHDAAEKAFLQVMQRMPDTPEAHRARFNQAAILLTRGQWAKGWAAFEHRRAFMPAPFRGVPLWDGQPGEEAVLLYSEQGLGDMVQFLRYLPEVVARRPVRLAVSDETCIFIRQAMRLPKERLLPAHGPATIQYSLHSLPFLFGLHDAPDPAPFFHVTEKPEPGLIGLCWAGNPAYPFDRRRSIVFEQIETHLAPLAREKGVRFLSLQHGHPVPDWMEVAPLEGLGALAAAVGRCALVVSVDTLVAHMAGAVGRPLWLLNRYGGDWRWQGAPWYRDVRQFRSDSLMLPRAEWDEVLRAVCTELVRLPCP